MTAVTDWRWRHGPVSGPLHGAVGLWAAYEVAALPAVDVGPGIVLGGGAIATGIVALRAAHDGSSRVGFVYRLAAMSGGTVWLAEAVTTGWTAGLGWSLAAGALLAGALHRPVRGRDRAAVVRREARAEAAALAEVDEMEQDRLHSVADRWIARIEKVCHIKDCTILGIEDWIHPGPDGQPRKTGYTLEVRLPNTGATWRSIEADADGLASAADLPEGCGIEVGPGASKRRALIEVSTLDALRDDIPYLPAAVPGSIDSIPFGVHRDGSQATAPMRFESTLLTGAKRSGKSNELLAVLGRILECNNTLVCVIDYNGGAVALPWLTPWVNGQIDDPPILWVADTEEEAELMCSWLIAVIEFRKKHYYAANAARDDDKIDASPQVPQLLLVTDEFGSLGKRVKDHIWQINDRGGGAAVTTLTCSLGSTSTYIPTELLAQLSNRIAMRVNEEKALGWLFEWQGGKGRPRPEDAPFTGYGHYRIAAGQPKVFKGPRIVPSVVRQVAVTTSAWRPRLDEATARMSPEWQRVFEQRWERSAHLVEAAGGRRPAGAGAGDAGPTATAAGGFREAPPSPILPDGWEEGGLGEAMDRLKASADRLRDAQPEPRDAAADAAEFERIMATEFEVAVPELLVRALVAFGQADRLHTRVLADALGVRVEHLGRLLSQLEVRPLKSDFQVDGKRGRGYTRADVEEAADRIRAGDLVPPEEVARWRPDTRPGGAGGWADLPPEWS